MESRIQRLLLTGFLSAVAAANSSAADAASGAVPEDLDLEPLAVEEPERRRVDVDEIDTENFEIGAFAGLMNVVDFGTNALAGVRAAYHVTEDFFVEGTYGMTQLDETSYERLSGSVELLTDDQRDLTYYSAAVGYNILPGEAFVGSRHAFKGALYMIGGAGSTEFGGEDRFTMTFGVGYRLIATDWLAVHVDVRDHVFDSDLLGAEHTYHNLEFSGALTAFF
jgi:outer membrane beta-barrel protein